MNPSKFSSSVRAVRSSGSRWRGLCFCGCLAVASLSANCGRWDSEAQYAAASNTDAASAYAKLLKVLADKGYHVTEQRDAERYIQVRAHVDENFVSRQSFIAAQVDGGGTVHFTPSGHLVRDGKVHKKLESELVDLQYAMRGDVGGGAAPSATASAAPAPSAAPVVASATPSAAPAPAPVPIAPAAPAATTAAEPAKPHTKPKAAAPTAPKPNTPPPSDDWVPVK